MITVVAALIVTGKELLKNYIFVPSSYKIYSE